MVSITSLGHAGFLVRHENQAILIDPWLDNPLFPEKLKKTLIPKGVILDAILVTHGHNSHVGSTLCIACEYRCYVFCVNEVALFLKTQGLPASCAVGLNIGGTVDFNGWEATLVWAAHSCSCNDINPSAMMPGGAAGGFVIKSPAGEIIYHAGDTAVTADMRIVNDLYNPSIAILPIGGHYCMGPKGAAYCIDNLLPTVQKVIPWSSCFAMTDFPVRKGSIEEVRNYTTRNEVQIIDLPPGENFTI